MNMFYLPKCIAIVCIYIVSIIFFALTLIKNFHAAEMLYQSSMVKIICWSFWVSKNIKHGQCVSQFYFLLVCRNNGHIAVRPSRLSKNYGMPCYSYGIPKFLDNLDGRTAIYLLWISMILVCAYFCWLLSIYTFL